MRTKQKKKRKMKTTQGTKEEEGVKERKNTQVFALLGSVSPKCNVLQLLIFIGSWLPHGMHWGQN